MRPTMHPGKPPEQRKRLLNKRIPILPPQGAETRMELHRHLLHTPHIHPLGKQAVHRMAQTIQRHPRNSSKTRNLPTRMNPAVRPSCPHKQHILLHYPRKHPLQLTLHRHYTSRLALPSKKQGSVILYHHPHTLHAPPSKTPGPAAITHPPQRQGSPHQAYRLNQFQLPHASSQPSKDRAVSSTSHASDPMSPFQARYGH